MRILLVDDDEGLVEMLARFLADEHYIVDTALDGQTGWELVQSYPYDMVLLDIKLPGLDGISFCRQLREQQHPVLVMLLTACDNTTDKLLGLNSGADDYVVKPLNLQEIAARIRALLRRGTPSAPSTLTCGELHLDLNTHEVTFRGQVLRFSRKEYLLLELFLRNQQRIYSCRDIGEHLWAFDANPPDDTTVRSHIKNIRRQLNAAGVHDFLRTVYGQGYRINPDYYQATAEPIQESPDLASPSLQQEELDRSVAQIWERTRHLSCDRLQELNHIVQAIQAGIFSQPLRQQAAQVAHKLVGSLGMFGLRRGSDLARQVEVLFQHYPEDPTAPCNGQQPQQLLHTLNPLLAELWQEVNGPGPSMGHDSPAADRLLTPPLKARIIAVDDDPAILSELRAVFEPLGTRIVGLRQTEQLWTSLAVVQPDLLILDINMPQIDGLTLCQTIRQSQQWNWLPILFLTACTTGENMQQAFAVGADDYLTKPLSHNDLVNRVRNRLQRVQVLRTQIEAHVRRNSPATGGHG